MTGNYSAATAERRRGWSTRGSLTMLQGRRWIPRRSRWRSSIIRRTGVPDYCECSRLLRPVRRQQPGTAGIRPQAAGGQSTLARRIMDVPPPRPDPGRNRGRRADGGRAQKFAVSSSGMRSASSAAETSATPTRVRRRRFQGSAWCACCGRTVSERPSSRAAQRGGSTTTSSDSRPSADGLVAIGPPSALHANRASTAARARTARLSESRSTSPTRRADAVIDVTCRPPGVKLWVFFQDRLRPAIARLKRMVDDGELGRP